MAKLLDHHSLADHEDLAHLLPSTKLMIIARRTATYITNMQQNGLRGLAQARRARSGEPPPRLGEGAKNKGMGNTGSRLSEIPLAWASCLLAQKLSEPPGRRFAQKNLGELPVSSRLGEIDSLGRDLQPRQHLKYWNPNFPYLEKGSHRPRHWAPKHSSSGDGSGTGGTVAQKEEQSHQPTLNSGIRRREAKTICFRVTYVVQEVGLEL
ncbi:hypothetical protein DEO72_LG9g617 [Vigna unguiculata]|uniref:Uncharacterized protein n=1 Tax=Vigna unguiculata TaxID=3917 RepID=A0A4D6MW05_VIGUN|nr:hypothetical protein DEO72_LG9g617 [Vigna unguiculata]